MPAQGGAHAWGEPEVGARRNGEKTVPEVLTGLELVGLLRPLGRKQGA